MNCSGKPTPTPSESPHYNTKYAESDGSLRVAQITLYEASAPDVFLLIRMPNAYATWWIKRTT
eukprot:9197812-Pyramimonas_sp.AAC.2